MTEGWRKVRLGDVADLSGGYAFKSSQYRERGHFVLRTVNIRDDFSITRDGAAFISEQEALEFKRFGLQDRDTLFVMVAATLGKVGYVRSDVLPALLNQNMWVIRAKPGLIEPDFLQFCFRELSKIPLAWVSGSARSFLRRDDVRNLEFLLPPLAEQRAIAATLGALDDKIELNRKMNETLEAMARALFRDWFVDFGPTRAKMEGRPAYLSEDLWSLFPDRLDEEGKPEGWEVSTIGEEVRVVGGSTPSTKEPEFWDGGISWATPKDLSTLSSPVLLETARTISESGLAKISSGLLPEGVLLLSSRAPIGYVAISEVPVAINQGFIGMICDKRVSNVFAWLWTRENMEAILAKANGSTFQEISKGNFRPLPVVVPSDRVQSAFDDIAKPLYARIAKNERESRALAQTRDLLLPRLMSGELSVRSMEAID